MNPPKHSFNADPTRLPGKTSALAELWSSLMGTFILGILCCGIYPIAVWMIAQGVFPNQANGSLLKRDGSSTRDDTQAVGSALIGQNFPAPAYFHSRPSAAGNGYDPTASGGSNYGPLSDKLINGAVQNPAPATQPTTAPSETLAYDGLRLRTLHYAMDNGLTFKLFKVEPDGTRFETPLKQFLDASGNLNDTALVDAFPHPSTDAPDRTILVATDFRNAEGSPMFIPADAVTASASGLDPHISPANASIQAVRIASQRKVSIAQVNTLIDQNTDRPVLGLLGDSGVNVLRLNLALDRQYPVVR